MSSSFPNGRIRRWLRPLRPGAGALALALIVGSSGCTPPSDEELLAKAEAAIAAGDDTTARIHLMNLLERNETNLEARVRLAALDLDAGNAGTAELGYRRAAKRAPNDVRVRAGQAQAVAQLGRYQEALELLQPDIAKTPADRARLLGLRGTLLMQTGDLQGARDCLDQALQLAPDDPDRVAEMAQLEVRAERFGEADQRIAQALALKPDHARALVLLGSRESAQQQLTAAEATFRRAAEIANAQHLRQVRLSALLALGEVQLLRQRTDQARQTLETLNGIAPAAPPVRFLRASLASQSGDDKKAIDELLLVLKEEPDNLAARRLLGLTYARTSQWNMAESHLAAVVSKNPDDMVARQALAAVRSQQSIGTDSDALTGRNTAPGQRKRSLTLAAAQELAFGRPLEALEYFQTAEKEFPQDVQLALGSALALLNGGEFDKAIEKLQTISGPETEAARSSMLISAYLRKGDKAGALSVANDRVTKYPGQAWAHDLQAAMLLTNGQAGPAQAALRRALAIDAGDPFALGGLVPLELEAGDISAAEVLLARAPQGSSTVQMLRGMVALRKGDARTAASLGEAAVKADPRNADGHNLLGLAMLAGGAPKAAASHFETAQLLAPRVPVYPLNLALAYLAIGDTDAAGEAASQARGLNADPDALAEIDFRLLLASRDFPAAEKQLAKITPKEPESTNRLLLLAELRQAQGDPKGAADALSTAFARAPSESLAIRTAMARQAAGRTDAKVPLEEWQRRAGPDADIVFANGSIDYAAGNRAAAKKQFEEALRIDPGHAQALNNLAWIYNEDHDRRAPELAERAYRAAPDEPSVLDTVGWVRLSSGKTAAALEVLSKAAASAPADPEIQYHLAVALIRNDRPADARQVLQNLLRSPATFPSRAAASEELERLGRG